MSNALSTARFRRDAASTAAGKGSKLVAFTPRLSGAVARWVEDKLSEQISVLDFGADPTGVASSTAAFQAAVGTGKSFFVPPGLYLCGEVTIPSGFAGCIITGGGCYPNTSASGITATIRASGAQNSIFKLSNGADAVGFRDLRLDGNNTADRCIDATFGAFLHTENILCEKSISYGLFSKQGVCKFVRSYFFRNAAVGLHAFSDALIDTCEASLGTIPIVIAAGGTRMRDTLANSGSVAQVRLAPYDASTNHTNTVLEGNYLGETRDPAGASVPMLDIQGIVGSQYVQSVQLEGNHFVRSVLTGNDLNKISYGIKADYVRDLSINGGTFLGIPVAYQTATMYADAFLKASRCSGLIVSGVNIRNCAKAPFQFTAGTVRGLNISNNVISDYSQNAAIATGAWMAAFRIDASCTVYGVIGGNTLQIETSDIGQYAIDGHEPDKVLISDNLYHLGSATPHVTKAGAAVVGSWLQAGAARYRFGSVGVHSQAYNGPNLALGTYQLWVDSSGRLRINNGTPATDTSGTVVGTQT